MQERVSTAEQSLERGKEKESSQESKQMQNESLTGEVHTRVWLCVHGVVCVRGQGEVGLRV